MCFEIQREHFAPPLSRRDDSLDFYESFLPKTNPNTGKVEACEVYVKTNWFVRCKGNEEWRGVVVAIDWSKYKPYKNVIVVRFNFDPMLRYYMRYDAFFMYANRTGSHYWFPETPPSEYEYARLCENAIARPPSRLLANAAASPTAVPNAPSQSQASKLELDPITQSDKMVMDDIEFVNFVNDTFGDDMDKETWPDTDLMLHRIEADLDAISIGSFSFSNLSKMSWQSNKDIPIPMSILSDYNAVHPPVSIIIPVTSKAKEAENIMEASDLDDSDDGDIIAVCDIVDLTSE